jgi:methionyl aminopeptidase
LERCANTSVEHTLLVTADGVEILTARKADSPGGPVPIPGLETNGESESKAGVEVAVAA